MLKPIFHEILFFAALSNKILLLESIVAYFL